MRAISTMLDVAVFLLLVSASVVTLVGVHPPEPAGTDAGADETAAVVTSTTLSLEYEIGGERRRAHGTAATLLARGATASATLEGHPLSTASAGYREAVREGTRQQLVAPNRTQLAVRWTPYRGAPVNGTVVVGPDPPDDVAVQTATATVPAPVPASRGRADERATDGYDGVGRAVAVAVTTGLLPSNRVDGAVYRTSPGATVTRSRYRTVGEATGVTVEPLLNEGKLAVAHRRATAGLAELFAEDMRERFDSPEAAAGAVRTGEVRIVVRRWEP